VLQHCAQHSALQANVGNIALLECAEQLGLLPQGVGHNAASAYRQLRQVQHRARLNEEPTQLEVTAMPAERAAVQVLWQQVFG
jgi:[glutamine synthetase] adenylyltransferase / [glutamine synthetase]-adenylyl-L-tyrosine phosphorylase